VLLSYEYVQPNMKALLPVNSMRNHALLLAQTPLVALLDADLMASASMAQGEQCKAVLWCSRCSCSSPFSRALYGVCASCGI
jgi:hypothetical protein